MRSLFCAFCMAILAAAPLAALGQEETAPPPRPYQERPVKTPRDLVPPSSSERTDDLWYGTPGVRPGGDLIEPIRDLVRNPSGLLDFRPRKVQSFLPDRETSEFLSEPHWIGEPRW
jgi:hypothetical protein